MIFIGMLSNILGISLSYLYSFNFSILDLLLYLKYRSMVEENIEEWMKNVIKGRRLTPKEIVDGYINAKEVYEEEIPEEIKNHEELDTIAYLLGPPLLNSTFISPQADSPSISQSLRAHLNAIIPNFDWKVNCDMGALKKYSFIHAMIKAPPFKDREMYLEMDITLVSMAGFKAGSKELKQHRKSLMLNEKGESLDKKQLRRSMLPIEGKCEFVISVATYSSIQYIGINMPFYM